MGYSGAGVDDHRDPSLTVGVGENGDESRLNLLQVGLRDRTKHKLHHC